MTTVPVPREALERAIKALAEALEESRFEETNWRAVQRELRSALAAPQPVVLLFNVMNHEQYVGRFYCGSFSSREKAQAYIDHHKREDRGLDLDLSIDECAIDENEVAVLATQHPTAPDQVCGEAEPVYLVATGEVHNGRETYERHEGNPPPLCDFETLYATPVREAMAANMLRRADALLTRWDEFYGKWCNGPRHDNALPPHGTVTLQEDIAEWLAAPAPVPAQADGWQWVPKVPTRDMLCAVDGEAEDKYLARGRAASAWQLMLSASPPHPGTTT